MGESVIVSSNVDPTRPTFAATDFLAGRPKMATWRLWRSGKRVWAGMANFLSPGSCARISRYVGTHSSSFYA